MEGKRVKYANPVRLYLVVSLVHFFVLSIYLDSLVDSGEIGVVQDATTDPAQRKNVITFSTAEQSNALEQDSTNEESDFFLNQESLSLINRMAKTHTLEEIMDSLHADRYSYFEKTTLRQLAKIVKSGSTSLSEYVQKNIPILMFFLLPIYALILKLFFRKRLYINHAVHSLHLHSFLFIILTLIWMIGVFAEPHDLLMPAVFLLLSGYLTASFKNTYNISVKRALLKVFSSGSVYFFILIMSFLITFTISFYTF